jgi:hypothetical protein
MTTQEAAALARKIVEHVDYDIYKEIDHDESDETFEEA